MKKIVYSILLAATILMTNSCSEDYLDTLPTDAISDKTAASTTDNLLIALNGIHRSLYIRYNSQGEGGLGGLYIINDMLGEDLVMTAAGNGWYNNIYKWVDHRNANDGDLLYPYRVYYRLIANANVIINSAADASGAEDAKSMLIGQALVYRAFCHYQLVQLYGKRYVAGQSNSQMGVPIMVENTTEGLPRASVEEVYTQINADLDQAIVKLAKYTRPNKSHINVDVAKGLKARVALTQGNYANAAKFAAEAKAGYQLMDWNTYRSGFNDFTIGEWMWGSDVIPDQTIYFADFFAYMSRNFSSTNIRSNPKAINSLLYAKIAATDVRATIFDPTGKHAGLPEGYALLSTHVKKPYTSQKFLAAGNSDSRGDMVHMRASEMYLIEAEAKARLGQDGAAADVLFVLASKRDPSYVKSTKTGQALLDEILIQRRVELWGEGFRFLDLKRLNMALDRTGSNHSESLTGGIMAVPAGDVRWEFLIPQDEIDANPAIEPEHQNPL